VVRALDLRLEMAGSIPASALSSAYSHTVSKPLPKDQKIVLHRIKTCQRD